MSIVPSRRLVGISLAGVLSVALVWRYAPDLGEIFSRAKVGAEQKHRVDSLAMILREIAMDTTTPPALSQEQSIAGAHWDARLDELDREVARAQRISALAASRSLRAVCWASNSCDVECPYRDAEKCRGQTMR